MWDFDIRFCESVRLTFHCIFDIVFNTLKYIIKNYGNAVNFKTDASFYILSKFLRKTDAQTQLGVLFPSGAISEVRPKIN